jgi:acyl-CoA synthetase (AMP-forming)/AMP-acid ligase II
LQLFPDILKQRAIDTPAAVAYRFFSGAALACEAISYLELFQRAASLARQLKQAHPAQTPLLLVCKSQKNFALGFFACLLADMIAVPTALPRRDAFNARLQLLASDAEVGGVLFDTDQMAQCQLATDGAALRNVDLRELPAESDPAAEPTLWPSTAHPDAVAFLQYTSGSTGDPKGVVVSHRNLAHNCALIQRAMRIGPHSAVLTALPMFHDMGLVGGLLQPVFAGCTGHWLSPAEFVQYPERWLQIISRFKITISGGPNFMYRLAAHNVEGALLADLDLSSWQVAFCGAEPIRVSTVADFAAAFAPVGFDPAAFYPCYGMAESTLFITGKKIGDMPRHGSLDGQTVMSCGVADQDTTVRIVDPLSGQPLAERQVGEIWISGASVARGYWRRPALSAATFEARLASTDANCLRSGDLGYLDQGELYVTGRLKDLLVINGKKYAPQDIEDAAERADAALCESGSAAFTVTRDDSELPVLVCELRREWLHRKPEWPALASRIRQQVHRACDLSLADVVFIRPGALARTTSGKVRRAECRAIYLAERWAEQQVERLEPAALA